MMTYETLFYHFNSKTPNIDETAFYFKNDPNKNEHFIGYIPGNDLPYWMGYCDVPNGCEFKTAKEMFEAPVFDGKSIKERWDEIVLLQIGCISVEKWEEWHESPHFSSK